MQKHTVRPTDIKLHQKSRILEVAFDDGSQFNFPCEFLRVYSPSAEVRGHGPGQEVHGSTLDPPGDTTRYARPNA